MHGAYIFNHRLHFYTSCTALYSGCECEKETGKGSRGNQLLPEGNLPKQGLESEAIRKAELNMFVNPQKKVVPGAQNSGENIYVLLLDITLCPLSINAKPSFFTHPNPSL